MAYSGNLRTKNLNAAKEVVLSLRNQRFMNEDEYRSTIMRSKTGNGNNRFSYRLPQNYDPITAYLTKNNLVTVEKVNGFNLYAITQKAYRSKLENLFEMPVTIQEGQVNTAVVICEKMHKYMDPDKFAEYITDTGTIPFKGATRTKFISLFKYWAAETDSPEDTFEVVLGKMKNVKIVK